MVDAIHRELALKCIGDAGLNVAEIAYLLQFSDATAFHRACKRWTGVAPARYRGRFSKRRGRLPNAVLIELMRARNPSSSERPGWSRTKSGMQHPGHG